MEAFDRLPLVLRVTFRSLLHEPRLLHEVEDLYRQLAEACGEWEAQDLVIAQALASEHAALRDTAVRWRARTGTTYPHIAAGASILR